MMVKLLNIAMCCVLVVCSPFSYATVTASSGCLVQHNNQCQATTSVYTENLPDNLLLSDNMGKQPDFITALHQYYQLAKQNNLADLIELYSTADGSRDIFSEGVRKTPTRYARFHKVGNINVSKAYRFGNYVMVAVVWHDKQGKRIANWAELLHCAKQCYMSERLMNSSSEVGFYAIFSKPPVSNNPPVITSDNIEVTYPDNSDYSASVTLAMTDYDALDSAERSKFGVVAELVNTLKANVVNANAEAKNNFKHIEQYNVRLFAPFWRNFDKSVGYDWPNKVGDAYQFSSMAYYVLASKLANLRSLKPMAVIKGNAVDFVMLATEDFGYMSVLTFYVDNDNKMISQADLNRSDSTIAELLQHPFVYKKLVARANQATTNVIAADSSSYIVDFKTPLIEKTKVTPLPVEPTITERVTTPSRTFNVKFLYLIGCIVLLLILFFIIQRQRNS